MFEKLKADVTLPDDKSRLVYTVLAMIFGGIGLHNFYAGNSEKAKAQLKLGLIGVCCFCYPLWLIAAVSAWMDAIYVNAYAAVKAAKAA